ncbi:hypothetical protein BG262_09760 [Floricoccus penangensis]|uniref:Competence protein ComGF n=1 Tax=Floricoccus penangensis TaxID=1859475 RepID=A0A9Q5JHS9_9LACT|nr:competence type IV pilus minor pilin ComGF [Floricoccus penangensis]OFI47425.1 hypothetical protein BG262_09760 [Floricoccus penangensis]
MNLNRIKAFTLIECLVALFVISGSLMVVQGLTKLLSEDMRYINTDKTLDWQLFCGMLRRELDGSELIKVENNYLYVKKDNSLRFGQPVGSPDFRKTHSSGRGYQPMIFGLKSTQIKELDKLVTFEITFDNGQSFSMLYKFQEGME